MSKFIGTGLVCVLALGALAATAADEAGKQDAKKAVKVAVLGEPGNYTIPKRDVNLIRVTPQAAAGSQVTIDVQGAGKLRGTNQITNWEPGQQGPAVGALGREYEIEPTGNGPVSVTFAVKSPGGEEETQEFVINLR